MQNSEYDPLSLPFASKEAAAPPNKLLVAATVAAVVLAGSAIAYRHAAINAGSTMRVFWKDSRGFEENLENEKNVEGRDDPDAMVGLTTVSTSTTDATGQELEYNTPNSTGITKSARSKDRRKRGKDPLKEALKSGKKLKSFPISAGSSSTPSSPKPPAAILSSSLAGKDKQVGENAELYSSFETGSSSAALQSQLMDASHDSPDSQRILTKRIQRKNRPTPATPATHLSETGHSRDTSDVSRFTHDEEDEEDVDFPATSSEHPHIQSPNSLSQSSISLPRSPSSLADVSEAEPEDGGWVTSVSKPHSKQRARLADAMFEDVRTWTGRHDRLENRAEDGGMPKSKRGTGYRHEELEATESYSNATPVVEVKETRMFPPSNGTAQGMQECRHEPRDPSHWDNDVTPSQSMAFSSAIRDISSNDLMNPDTEGKEQETDGDRDRKQPRFQAKGTNGMSYTSEEGGEGRLVIGRCQTVSITTAVASKTSASGLGSTETDEASGAPPSRTEDGETEFTFPTLNSASASGPSTRARSTLIGTPVSSSSPSKKTKRFSSNKSGTPPPNVPPSRTSSPSNIRENHTASYVQGPNSGGGSSSTPALSTQTQLASLRGALEAARQREEKHKTEMEKVMKELEVLKWESTNNRRGEAELQAQVRQLTHQLQSYAALFASVAPHLNSHFAMQLHPRANDPHASENSPSDIHSSDPGTSPKVDPSVELPNGGAHPSASKTPEVEKLELQAAEAQEEEPASSSDKAQGQNHVPVKQPLDLPPSPASNVSGISSPLLGAQHPMSPPSSAAAIPPFFPYYMPTQHPHFPVHHPPWMYHPYQPQRSTQTVSGTAGGPSSPPPPPHYTNIYSPMVYPISPVAPPLSPQSGGMMSPPLFHQYQQFGFGGGLRSAGASSTGSHSPELTGGLGKPKPRVRRRKSQLADLNGNPNAGWEDVGDGWIGLSKVVMQPATTNVEKATADGEGEEDDVESASSPYSELLADAILKRSSTIRPSKKNGKKENGPLDRQESTEEVEPFSEFTFPSLSDVYYRTTSRTESSISSSLSSSPPSTAATVPDFTGDPKWEEDKSSLPPVIEKTEDLAPSASDAAMAEAKRDMPLSNIQDIVSEQTTPKEEDREQSLADLLKR